MSSSVIQVAPVSPSLPPLALPPPVARKRDRDRLYDDGCDLTSPSVSPSSDYTPSPIKKIRNETKRFYVGKSAGPYVNIELHARGGTIAIFSFASIEDVLKDHGPHSMFTQIVSNAKKGYTYAKILPNIEYFTLENLEMYYDVISSEKKILEREDYLLFARIAIDLGHNNLKHYDYFVRYHEFSADEAAIMYTLFYRNYNRQLPRLFLERLMNTWNLDQKCWDKIHKLAGPDGPNAVAYLASRIASKLLERREETTELHRERDAFEDMTFEASFKIQELKDEVEEKRNRIEDFRVHLGKVVDTFRPDYTSPGDMKEFLQLLGTQLTEIRDML